MTAAPVRTSLPMMTSLDAFGRILVRWTNLDASGCIWVHLGRLAIDYARHPTL